MNYPKIHRYGLNKLGRDFVIGDIHGVFDTVKRGLELIKFNADVDRVFALGDLINRGRESRQALEFLSLPYVHSIRGNHDSEFASMQIEEIRQYGSRDRNGMGWVKDVSDDLLIEIRERLFRLPLVIEVQTARGLVGLVHADIPAGTSWPVFMKKIADRDEVATKCALWGRDRLKANDCSGVEGVGRVYVGHTVQWSGPRRLGNLIAIDTGAVFRESVKGKGALTILNLECSSAGFTPRPGITEEMEFIIRQDAEAGAFRYPPASNKAAFRTSAN